MNFLPLTGQSTEMLSRFRMADVPSERIYREMYKQSIENPNTFWDKVNLAR